MVSRNLVELLDARVFDNLFTAALLSAVFAWDESGLLWVCLAVTAHIARDIFEFFAAL